MKSLTTSEFWECYSRLPVNIKALARCTYKTWSEDPKHGSLHSRKYAAYGRSESDCIIVPSDYRKATVSNGFGSGIITSTIGFYDLARSNSR